MDRVVRRMYDGVGSAASDEATAEYYAYIVELIAERRATPRDDFVTMLLTATVEGHRLSDMTSRGSCGSC